MHAVGLLGALASEGAGGAFVVAPADHAGIGLALAAVMSGAPADAADTGAGAAGLLLLQVAAADALMDAYAADCAEHDAARAASGIVRACEAALSRLGAALRSAGGPRGVGAPVVGLDREAAGHARSVLANVRRFVEYRGGRGCG